VASIEEIREARLAKLKLLTDNNIEPYPADSKRELSLKEVLADFDTLEKTKVSKWISGRIMSIRGQGAIIFITLNDGTSSFQGLLKKDTLGEEKLGLFNATADIGDFVEIQGTFFVTQRGEKSVEATEWRMLSKSLRPLPEKWHGLADTEERFRKRYLDLLSNPEVKEKFILRSRLVSEIRRILDEAGYLEVETPALQPVYGGASAEPFVTHHNTLDTDLYLRISDELYLKRLLAGGFPKVYEIARDFRNEGIDHTHNPEFTMLEFYEAYSNAPLQMEFVESMMKTIVRALFNKDEIEWKGETISFKGAFEVYSYFDLLKKHTSLQNPASATFEDLTEAASKEGVSVAPADSFYKVMDNIYKKSVRPKLMQPTFIIDYPADYLPLAKKKRGEENIVEAFQLVIGGIELVKAFSELNDPIDQRQRFVSQEETKAAGEKDAQVLDEDFLEAMEYGIPPAGGVGIGIDRLSMLLTNTENIKEVILFPTLRPKN
jgi:lysyl-tRNA synthetase class 2